MEHHMHRKWIGQCLFLSPLPSRGRDAILHRFGLLGRRPISKFPSTMSDPPSPGSSFQLRAPANYEYGPLPGTGYIRRVKLHPGTFEEAVVISLDVVPFSEDQHFEYEALSYVWESPEQHEVIQVDENNGPIILITPNFAIALTHLRRRDKPRILCIDALCINQTDDVEKCPQVAMMGDIYRYATRVVVWLGPEANNSASAMSAIEYLGSQIQLVVNGMAAISSADGATDLELSNSNVPLHLWSHDADAITRLLSRPWFGRLQTAPASQHRLAEKLTSLGGFTPSFFRPPALRSLRTTFQSADCFDPRDRIYAVLSMLPDWLREGIEPDYTKPFGDVYRDVVLHCLHISLDFSILGACEFSKQINMPSWVLDWSQKSSIGILAEGLDQLASSQITSSYALLENDVLRVAGVSVGTIQHLEETSFQHPWLLKSSYKELRRLILDMIYPNKEVVDDDTLVERVARTFTFGKSSDTTLPHNEWAPSIEGAKQMVRTMLSDPDLPSNLSQDEVKFLSVAGACLIRVQIFRTADDQFGAAPPQAQLGDHICVLLGCSCPIILRETPSGAYLVVGPCYMHTVNQGEALLGPLPGHVRRLLVSEDGPAVYRWKDSRSGALFRDDPRLESLGVDPENFGKRGEGSKLRVDPELLRRRGVDVKYFDLV
ncbi:ankyrin and het domain protein [Diaporthe eres]|nr:ankyrin and het domain protein [Diaporthe eres]